MMFFSKIRSLHRKNSTLRWIQTLQARKHEVQCICWGSISPFAEIARRCGEIQPDPLPRAKSCYFSAKSDRCDSKTQRSNGSRRYKRSLLSPRRLAMGLMQLMSITMTSPMPCNHTAVSTQALTTTTLHHTILNANRQAPCCFHPLPCLHGTVTRRTLHECDLLCFSTPPQPFPS